MLRPEAAVLIVTLLLSACSTAVESPITFSCECAEVIGELSNLGFEAELRPASASYTIQGLVVEFDTIVDLDNVAQSEELEVAWKAEGISWFVSDRGVAFYGYGLNGSVRISGYRFVFNTTGADQSAETWANWNRGQSAEELDLQEDDALLLIESHKEFLELLDTTASFTRQP